MRFLIYTSVLFICSTINLKAQDYAPTVQFEVKKLPFNTDLVTYSPVLKDGDLIFVASNESKEGYGNADIRLSEVAQFDYFISKKDSITGDFSKEFEFYEKSINTKANEGPFTFYDEGLKVLFTKNNISQTFQYTSLSKAASLGLYDADVDENGYWVHPRPLSFNNVRYSIGHPAVDPSNKYLVFMSKANKGLGKSDLYVSKRDENGEWGSPVAIGKEINTEEHEAFPVFSPLGNLYFSSTRRGGMGGLDIYLSYVEATDEDIIFQKAVRLPKGINTFGDDLGLCFTEGGKRAYYSSSAGPTKKNDNIYQIDLLPPFGFELTFPKKINIKEFDENGHLLSYQYVDDIERYIRSNSDKVMMVTVQEKGEPEKQLAVDGFLDIELLADIGAGNVHTNSAELDARKSLIGRGITFRGRNFSDTDIPQSDGGETKASQIEEQYGLAEDGILEEKADASEGDNVADALVDKGGREIKGQAVIREGAEDGISEEKADASESDITDLGDNIADTSTAKESNEIKGQASARKNAENEISIKDQKDDILSDNLGIGIAGVTTGYEIKSQSNGREGVKKILLEEKADSGESDIVDSGDNSVSLPDAKSNETEAQSVESKSMSKKVKAKQPKLISNTIKKGVFANSSTAKYVLGPQGKGITTKGSKIVKLQDSTNEPQNRFLLQLKNGQFAELRGGFGNLDKVPVYNNSESLALQGYMVDFGRIYFAFDKCKVTAGQMPYLLSLGEMLRENPNIIAVGAVHADSRGSDEYNMLLTKRRARAIDDFIHREMKIPIYQLEFLPKGEKELLNNCGNDVQCSYEQHAENRKAVFTYSLK